MKKRSNDYQRALKEGLAAVAHPTNGDQRFQKISSDRIRRYIKAVFRGKEDRLPRLRQR